MLEAQETVHKMQEDTNNWTTTLPGISIVILFHRHFFLSFLTQLMVDSMHRKSSRMKRRKKEWKKKKRREEKRKERKREESGEKEKRKEKK